MNPKQRTEFIKNEFAKMIAISESKGVEYANDDSDANANFKIVGQQLGIDPKMACWVYAMKHIQSISQYIRTGSVKSNEGIDGRLHDLALYCMLLLSLIEEEKRV